MELFIDTPQRAHDRMERMRQLYLEQRNLAEARSAALAAQLDLDEPDDGLFGGDAADVPKNRNTHGTAFGGAARTRCGEAGRTDAPDAGRRRGEPEVPAADAYRAERAFDRRRARRTRLVRGLRVLMLLVAVPIAAAIVFVAAYALTFIVNGATYEEVVSALANLANRVGEFASQAFSARPF